MPKAIYRWLISLASWMAPAGRREQWQREWLAEVNAQLETLKRWGRLSIGAHGGLLMRCLGALVDAGYFRADSLREGIVADVRFGVRLLVRTPGFTLAAIVALACGIGMNTALFSAIYALLLRLPAVDEPESVVVLYTQDYSSTRYGTSSYPDYQDIARHSRTLSSVAAFVDADARARFGDQFEQLEVSLVTPAYFRTLGVKPVMGRLLGGEETGAVVGEALWERRYARRPDVAGRTIEVNGKVYPIVGVAPAAFRGSHIAQQPEVWLPLRAAVDVLGADASFFVQRASRGLALIGRLAPGASVERAQAEMTAFAGQFAKIDKASWTTQRGETRAISVLALADAGFDPDGRREAVRMAWIACAVVGGFVLIVCATVGTMLLARSQARRREIAIRLSLGAERLRVLRQLLTESGLLCLAGGGAGLLLARWTIDFLNRTPELQMGLGGFHLQLDRMVLLHAAASIFASTILAGAAPAWRASREDLIAEIKSDFVPLSARFDRSRVASLFVASQIAISVTLLLAGVLLLRSLYRAQSVNRGFRVDGVTLARIDPGARKDTPEEASRFVREVHSQLASIPGIESAALAASVQSIDRFGRRGMPVEGHEYAPGETREFHVQFVSPGYFSTLGIPILDGRDFSWRDGPDSQRVVIVNELFANRYWPGESAIGRRIRSPRGPVVVAGVVRATRFRSPGEPPLPMAYYPLTQDPRGRLIAHLTGHVDAGLVRERLRSLDAGLVVTNVHTYQEAISRATMAERFATALVAGSGLLALFLAALGLYGVLSHAVAQSRREIGIRLAVGASRGDVYGEIFRRAARLFVPGAGAGLGVGLGFGRLLESWLYGVRPYDPASVLVVLLLLTAAALVAVWLPARRAVRIDAIAALRHE